MTPPEAAQYLSLTSDVDNKIVNHSAVLVVVLTLHVSPDIHGITSFSFDVNFDSLDARVVDLNLDGKCDMKDIAIVSKATSTQNPIGDVNQDGKVDMKDVAIVAKHFGATGIQQYYT
jgi:hypothetical protein